MFDTARSVYVWKGVGGGYVHLRKGGRGLNVFVLLELTVVVLYRPPYSYSVPLTSLNIIQVVPENQEQYNTFTLLLVFIIIIKVGHI